jgi:HPt (histidine-containing phosphotransfer) domain-containing protein
LGALLQKVESERARLVHVILENRDDADRLSTAGHELKGMLASFGLKAAADVAFRIETEALEPDQVVAEIEALEAAYSRGAAQIRARLQKGGEDASSIGGTSDPT